MCGYSLSLDYVLLLFRMRVGILRTGSLCTMLRVGPSSLGFWRGNITQGKQTESIFMGVEFLRRQRYDYFLIWGNGLPYQNEILDILRDAESIEIIRLTSYKPKNIAKLVRAIYSYDYAPLQHLRAKTRYLLETIPEVLFIFVLNRDARERYVCTGAFRHVECANIKSIKEEIRNRFNPRKEGKRTEEHVIHASDNESQVDHILKYLGVKAGVSYLKNI